ncbi:unnamed protein product [Prorocentrum cordatum]|uniref:Uncharacterized protein n=1 Tax=Prorocentrum cordatum TaxID=2364126 RepID=A0ABN9TNE5_9DINO|nr:unnamed protein product [Polarella glacialis]
MGDDEEETIAAAPVEEEEVTDLMTAVRKVLKNALVVDGVIRGLHEAGLYRTWSFGSARRSAGFWPATPRKDALSRFWSPSVYAPRSAQPPAPRSGATRSPFAEPGTSRGWPTRRAMQTFLTVSMSFRKSVRIFRVGAEV